jgi:hypothetical protein
MFKLFLSYLTHVVGSMILAGIWCAVVLALLDAL